MKWREFVPGLSIRAEGIAAKCAVRAEGVCWQGETISAAERWLLTGHSCLLGFGKTADVQSGIGKPIAEVLPERRPDLNDLKVKAETECSVIPGSERQVCVRSKAHHSFS